MARKVRVSGISRVLAKIQQLNMLIEGKKYGEVSSLIRDHIKDLKKLDGEAKNYYIELAIARLKKLKIQALLEGLEEQFTDLSELEEYLKKKKKKL